jgi:hypothetical protein
LLAAAPAEGVPIATILQIPSVGSGDGVDHLLHRMVLDGEIERRGRGRYGLPPLLPGAVPHDVAQPITPDRGASPKPEAPIPAAPEPPREAVLRDPTTACSLASTR